MVFAVQPFLYKKQRTLFVAEVSAVAMISLFELSDIFRPDFVNAYPKNHQRIEVRYVDAVS